MDSDMSAVRLQLCEIGIAYAGVPAVADLSLSVEGGEILGLLGPNGSGKSTTLNAIAGVLDLSAGEIRINSITRDGDPDSYSRLVGLVPQEPAIYDELTISENLAFFGQLYGLGGVHLQRRMQEVLDRVRLSLNQRGRLETLSGGMRRRVNLACALLHDPSVLLLDEPTVALDPPSREALFETLESLRDDGRIVILTTHELVEAEQICDRVALLKRGQLIAQGRLSEFEVTERATLVGQLREALAEEIEQTVRNRLPEEVEFRIVGRRIRLQAPNGESLGQALATLYSEGVLLDSFRTPSAQLEAFFFDDPIPTGEGARCVAS
jgi:ABC-2 type transport system ATP-binding protein